MPLQRAQPELLGEERARGGVATSRPQAPGAGSGLCPTDGSGATSWVCQRSDPTDLTQSGWGGRTFSQGSSCLHPAPWLAAATQTRRPSPGCQAELKTSLPRLVGFCREEPNAHPHLQGQLPVQAAVAFLQAFVALRLCARHCARLCLTQMDPHGPSPRNMEN